MVHSKSHALRLARELAAHLVDRHDDDAIVFAHRRLSRVRGTPREDFARHVVDHVEQRLGDTRAGLIAFRIEPCAALPVEPEQPLRC